MQNSDKNLEDAERLIQTADHLVYSAFQLIQEKRIFLKTLLKLKNAIQICINTILKKEYLNKNIEIFQNQNQNFISFKQKCAKKYQVTENEIKEIERLFEIVEHYEKSSMEFIKNKEVVILSPEMKKIQVNISKIKDFLLLSKKILKKTKGDKI